jgi:hypothetical protein
MIQLGYVGQTLRYCPTGPESICPTSPESTCPTGPESADIYSRQSYCAVVGNIHCYSAFHNDAWIGHNRQPLCDIRNYMCQEWDYNYQHLKIISNIKFCKYQHSWLCFTLICAKGFNKILSSRCLLQKYHVWHAVLRLSVASIISVEKTALSNRPNFTLLPEFN